MTALLLPAGLLASIVLFLLMMRLRPDFVSVVMTPRLLMKFGVTLSLAAAALLLAERLVRPGMRKAPYALWLLLPLGVLAVGVAGEFGVRDPRRLAARHARALSGATASSSWRCCRRRCSPRCSSRSAAARRRGRRSAGAVAGLAAGGLGAALYALHCTDDSPLFVLVWYSIGIGLGHRRRRASRPAPARLVRLSAAPADGARRRGSEAAPRAHGCRSASSRCRHGRAIAARCGDRRRDAGRWLAKAWRQHMRRDAGR